jgi:selT/selW/selH-like putative selenoprotein
VSVTAELIKEFEPHISSWTLIPGGGGAFEVKVGDALVYSKLQTGRHTTSDELRPLIKAKL